MRRFFFDNLSLKLIALVLSLVLFLVVRGEERTASTVEVPVLIRVPSDYVVVNEPVDTVSVELHGRWSQLKELSIDELGPISIAPHAGTGRSTITLEPEYLTLPPGLTVERFDPPSIVVSLEEEATREVPVAVERALSGEPPPGYQLGDVSAEPTKVAISGPRSVVEMVHRVFVEPIELTGRTSDIRVQRHVVPDRRGIKVEGDPIITVEIEIVAKAQELVLEDVPVHLLDVTEPHELVPRRVDLVLVGEKDALSRVDPEEVYVAFEVSDEQQAPSRSSQLVIKPQNVHNLPPGVGLDTSRAPSVVLWMLPEPEPPPEPTDGTLEDGTPDGPQPTDPTAPAPGESPPQ